MNEVQGQEQANISRERRNRQPGKELLPRAAFDEGGRATRRSDANHDQQRHNRDGAVGDGLPKTSENTAEIHLGIMSRAAGRSDITSMLDLTCHAVSTVVASANSTNEGG